MFNLLPLAPLDGSTGILIFMSESTAQRYLDWLRESSYARSGCWSDCWLFAIFMVRSRCSPRICSCAAIFKFSQRFCGWVFQFCTVEHASVSNAHRQVQPHALTLVFS